MSPVPDGRVVRLDDRLVLHVDRSFVAPIEDVWAAITEPERLARWIGTWTGDPSTGSVRFAMTFEGQEEGDAMVIHVCEPPHRLHVSTQVGDELWPLELDLTHDAGVTTLTFRQPGVTREQVGTVAPGWDYYLSLIHI